MVSVSHVLISIGIEKETPESPGQAVNPVQLFELMSHSWMQNGPHIWPIVPGLEERTLM